MNKEQARRWREDEGRMVARLRADLAAANGLSGHPREPKLWALAWDYGHASGAVEVRTYYDELAELLK